MIEAWLGDLSKTQNCQVNLLEIMKLLLIHRLSITQRSGNNKFGNDTNQRIQLQVQGKLCARLYCMRRLLTNVMARFCREIMIFQTRLNSLVTTPAHCQENRPSRCPHKRSNFFIHLRLQRLPYQKTSRNTKNQTSIADMSTVKNPSDFIKANELNEHFVSSLYICRGRFLRRLYNAAGRTDERYPCYLLL